MNTGFGAYFALFSEIGMILLVTTLAGVAAGYWADQKFGTLPIFVLVGLSRRRRDRDGWDLPLDHTVPEAVRLNRPRNGHGRAWPMAARLLGRKRDGRHGRRRRAASATPLPSGCC